MPGADSLTSANLHRDTPSGDDRGSADPYRLKTNKVRDWFFGKNGGVRNSDFDKMTQRTCLSDWLPWYCTTRRKAAI